MRILKLGGSTVRDPERHRQAARTLTEGEERAALEGQLRSATHDLGEMVHGIFLLRESSPRSRDGVAGYGERLSASLIAAACRYPSGWPVVLNSPAVHAP